MIKGNDNPPQAKSGGESCLLFRPEETYTDSVSGGRGFRSLSSAYQVTFVNKIPGAAIKIEFAVL